MTTETFTPATAYAVSGTGPYAFPFQFSNAGDVVAFAVNGTSRAQLTQGSDFTVSPEAPADGGSVVLTAAAATTYVGQVLEISRATILEQGWTGTQSAREKGLERQLDVTVRAAQDLLRRADLALQLAPSFVGTPVIVSVPEEDRALVGGPNGETIVLGPSLAEIEGAASQANSAAQSAAVAAQRVIEAQTAQDAAQAAQIGAATSASEAAASAAQAAANIPEHGAVGDRAFLRRADLNQVITHGVNYTGSTLRWSGVSDGTQGSTTQANNVSVAGIWRAQGSVRAAAADYSMTQFVRIF